MSNQREIPGLKFPACPRRRERLVSSAITARHEEVYAVELLATVEALLKQSPEESLCAACLAFACQVSLQEMREAVERLVGVDTPTIEVHSTCASCRRMVPSAIYRPHVGKCAHCSQLIAKEEVSSFIGGDLFHAACWRRLVTDETIRTSRALSRRSRAMIEESRRRIREGRSWAPVDPSA